MLPFGCEHSRPRTSEETLSRMQSFAQGGTQFTMPEHYGLSNCRPSSNSDPFSPRTDIAGLLNKICSSPCIQEKYLPWI
jgi:hypothetical protein